MPESDEFDPMLHDDVDESGRVRVLAFQLLTRYQSMLQAYAYAIVRDHHQAEDVYQEVATVVARAAHNIPPEDRALPWMREIARRKALELRRKSQRNEMLLSPEVLQAIGPAFEAVADEGDAGDLRAAMADCVEQLPSDARTVIEGRYGSDHSCEELAEKIGRSVKGVYGMLRRLRQLLARCVQQKIGRPVSQL